MNHDHPESTAQFRGHPIHPALIPLPLTFLTTVFVTDLVYLATDDPAWALGSRWLLIAGLVTAALAALAGFIDFFGSRRIRSLGLAWAHMIGNLLAVLLQAANLFLRMGDNYADAVAPAGVVISGLVFAILGFTGWAGGELVFRHGVAVVADEKERPPSAAE